MKLREVDWLALLMIAVCIMLGVASHNALNPDGVSYLDLAARLRAGDWSHFVQGYWSPLYPALVALGSLLTGREGPALIGLVHVLNTLLAILGVGVLWWSARRSGSALFGRSLFAVYLLCSAQAPRLEAVTPDLLLLALVALIGTELVVFGGRRWLLLGLWMGLAFLAKTSIWPWLLVAILLRGATAANRTGRRIAGLSALSCVAVMSLWLIPLSVRSGELTLGSTGRLASCWYMRECDSRSPDTHSGEHRRYQVVAAGSSQATVASLAGTPWTYLPWSDPTEWAAGVLTARRVTPTLAQHLLYAGKQLVLVFGVWMPHIWLGVLFPMVWITRRRGLWRELVSGRRDAAVVMVLGLVGMLQFVAVHAEPRLVAPFVLLFSFGTLAWLCAVPTAAGATAIARTKPSMLLLVLSWVGFVSALPRSVGHALEQWDVAQHTEARMTTIAAAEVTRVPGPRRIAVIGEVFPLLTEVYRLGGTIELQVFRPKVADLASWPPQDQRALLAWLATQGATEAWLNKSEGAFNILPLTPP